MVMSMCFCLACSASFHLLMVKSPAWNSILSRLDYGGISIAILGGNIPIIYYSFACQPHYQQRYIWVGCETALCLFCFVTSLLKQFDSPAFRPVRGIMFIFAGLSTVGIFLAILINPSPYNMNTNWLWYAIGGYVFI